MIDLKEVKRLVDAKQAVLVDVREQNELEETGTAEGALWMPTSLMDDDEPRWAAFKNELPKDKPVYVFCRSGNRSGRVAFFLQEMGFQAENSGGFVDWKNAGLPVAKFKA